MPLPYKYLLYQSYAAPVGEIVTEEKWHQAWSTPYLKKTFARTLQKEYVSPILPPPVTEDMWHQPWSVPRVLGRKEPAYLQPIGVSLPSSAVETIFEDKWHQGWSIPSVLEKKGFKTYLQRDFTISPFALTQPETVMESKWHQEWSMPASLARPGLRAAEQQTLALTLNIATPRPRAQAYVIA